MVWAISTVSRVSHLSTIRAKSCRSPRADSTSPDTCGLSRCAAQSQSTQRTLGCKTRGKPASLKPAKRCQPTKVQGGRDREHISPCRVHVLKEILRPQKSEYRAFPSCFPPFWFGACWLLQLSAGERSLRRPQMWRCNLPNPICSFTVSETMALWLWQSPNKAMQIPKSFGGNISTWSTCFINYLKLWEWFDSVRSGRRGSFGNPEVHMDFPIVQVLMF